MRGRYECLGGPMDGDKIPRSPEGYSAFCAMNTDYEGQMVMHFYRLCTHKRKIQGEVRVAKFWHYIGTNPDAIRKPTLRPHERLYK